MPTKDEQKIKELELLYRVSQILDENMDMRNVLRPVMDTLGDYMGFQHATVTLYNRQTGEISIELATGLSPTQTKKGRYKVGEGITGKVVETGKPIVVPDVTKDPNFLDRTGRGKISGKAFICVPISIEKEVVGALSVDEFNSSKDQLDEDLRLLEIIAMMIASAVKLRRQAEEETEILLAENERL